MKTISDVTRLIEQQATRLTTRHAVEQAVIGRAVHAIARCQPLESPLADDPAAVDSLTRLAWLLHVREVVADSINLALSMMRVDVMSAGTMTLAEIFDDLRFSAESQQSRLPDDDERLTPSWYHSANALQELLDFSGADLALLLLQPLSEWRGDDERLALVRKAASDRARDVLDNGPTLVLGPLHSASEYTERAKLLYREGYSEPALADIDAALAADPTDPEARVLKVSAALNQDEYDDALALANEGLSACGDHAMLYFKRGLAHLELHDCQQDALADFNRALELGLEQPELAHFNCGLVLAELERPQEAVAACARACEGDPDWLHARVTRAMAEAQLGEFDAAIRSFDAAIALDPDDPELPYNRAFCNGSLKRYSEAIADLDRALELNSDYAHAWGNRGYAKEHSGDPQAALADYDEAIRLDPENLNNRTNRARARAKTGAYRGAINDLNLLLKEYPDDLHFRCQRAAAYEALGNPALATADYVAALQHASADSAELGQIEAGLERLEYPGPRRFPWPVSPYLRAVSEWREARSPEEFQVVAEPFLEASDLHSQGMPSEALAKLEQALALDDSLIDAHILQARLQVQLDDFDAALASIERALEICPQADEVYLVRAEFHAARGDYPAAQADVSTALEHYPYSSKALYNRGRFHYECDETEQARAGFESALALDPADQWSLEGLGRLLHHGGEGELALRYFDRLVELQPEDLDLLCDRGLIKATLDREDDAVEDWNAATILNPWNPRPYLSRVTYYQRREQFEHAMIELVLCFQLCGAESPEMEQVQDMVGYLDEMLSDGRELHWPLDFARRRLALVLHHGSLAEEDQREIVDRFFDLLLERDPAADLWQCRGELLHEELFDDQGAIEAFEAGLAIASSKSRFHQALGRLHYDNDAYQTAVEHIEKALADPSPPQWPLAPAWEALAYSYHELDDSPNAARAFEMLAEVAPDDDRAWFYFGMHIDRQGDRKRSLAAYTRSLELNDSQPAAWFNRACEHAILGNRDAALADLREAVKRHDDYRQRALSEEYFSVLHSDPEFLAVLRT